MSLRGGGRQSRQNSFPGAAMRRQPLLATWADLDMQWKHFKMCLEARRTAPVRAIAAFGEEPLPLLPGTRPRASFGHRSAPACLALPTLPLPQLSDRVGSKPLDGLHRAFAYNLAGAAAQTPRLPSIRPRHAHIETGTSNAGAILSPQQAHMLALRNAAGGRVQMQQQQRGTAWLVTRPAAG